MLRTLSEIIFSAFDYRARTPRSQSFSVILSWDPLRLCAR
jgi:hypothetical protein